jgi:DNA-binding transcriptional ArsR family regulator
MLEGTEREVLELLLERPRSPTEVADELEVSVQTASRNLKRLVEQEFAERTRDGGGRGYKRYRAREFAQVFAGYDGGLFEKTLSLSAEKRAVLSVWQVPQPEFHSVLLSYLLNTDIDRMDLEPVGFVVYGSVARGDAQLDSDIDLLIIHDPSRADLREAGDMDMNEFLTTSYSMSAGPVDSETVRVISEEWFTVSEFHDALDAGSQFLRNVLNEGIVLYDPEGVIWDAKRERAGERVPQ